MSKYCNRIPKRPLIKLETIPDSNEEVKVEDLKLIVKYIEIHKSYTENKYRNHFKMNVPNYLKTIKVQNFKSSLFEVLSPFQPLKPYFDIEKIPVDQSNLIYDIIGDLRT